MTWIRDIEKDEIRDGFLVTTDRKKLWNVEIELLNFLKELCQQHGIRYFAIYGTLLGAVRHHGFIPWDDDIDVGMLRPDYNRFLRVAREAIKEPYFLQNMYSDRAIQFSKIRDSRTSAIEFPDCLLHQGIFIDIFPFDAGPDGSEEMDRIYTIQKELWMAVRAPEDVESGLAQGAVTQAGEDTLRRMIAMPLRERMDVFETFMEMQFEKSSKVGSFSRFMREANVVFAADCFEESLDMPFETTTLSVPIGYEDYLRGYFGNDYLQRKRYPTAHPDAVFSADIPYEEYLAQIHDTSSEQ